MRLVHHGDGAGAPQQRRELLALGVRHQVAGRVLEVRDQVGQLRPGLPQEAAHGSEVPAVDVHRQPDAPGPGPAQRRVRVRVAGALHQHAVAGADQALRDHGECGQRSGHHHDLRRVRRQTTGVVGPGHRLLEGRHAGGEVPVSAEVAGQVLHGLGVRRPDAGQRRRCGTVQVDHVVVGGRRCEGPVEAAPPASGQTGVRAGPLARRGEPALDQAGVRPGDGRPRDAQGDAQVAFAGQPEVDADPAVADQQPQLVGESRVRGPTVEARGEGGQAWCSNGSDHAVHSLTSGYL